MVEAANHAGHGRLEFRRFPLRSVKPHLGLQDLQRKIAISQIRVIQHVDKPLMFVGSGARSSCIA
jgi:hypothetical protein